MQLGKDTNQYQPQQHTAGALSKDMGSGQHQQKYRVVVAQEASKKANVTAHTSTTSLPAWRSSKAGQADLTSTHGPIHQAAAAAAADHQADHQAAAATTHQAVAAAGAAHQLQAEAAAVHQAAAAAAVEAAAVHLRRMGPMDTQQDPRLTAK